MNSVKVIAVDLSECIFFFQAEDGIRDVAVTGVQTCALPIFVGVANAYSTITPCNLGLDLLAKRAEAALRTAGVMPQTFGTITVSDGISMGTEGMKYSLVSREVIADSIETACNAQSMDGLLVVGGCDKDMPGAMIALGPPRCWWTRSPGTCVRDKS